MLVATKKEAAETRTALLCELLSNPINFPVRDRKRFIFFLTLESFSIRLMLTSDGVFLRFVTARCVSYAFIQSTVTSSFTSPVYPVLHRGIPAHIKSVVLNKKGL
jgi:hypothetical protein